MGKYRGNSCDQEEVFNQYARGGQISCKGQKLAANDLHLSRGELEKLLEQKNIQKAKMGRGRS